MGVSAVDRLVVVTAVAGRPLAPGPSFPAPRPTPQIGRAVQTEPPIDDDSLDEDLEADALERDEPPVRGRQGGPVLNPWTAAAPTCPRADARGAARHAGNPFGAVQGATRPGAIAPQRRPSTSPRHRRSPERGPLAAP